MFEQAVRNSSSHLRKSTLRAGHTLRCRLFHFINDLKYHCTPSPLKGGGVGGVLKNEAETTHQNGLKRPTSKAGRNDPGRNDPAETTHGQNDSCPKRLMSETTHGRNDPKPYERPQAFKIIIIVIYFH